MRRRLVASYLLIVALALIAFTVPVAVNLDQQLREGQREIALREARTIAVLLAPASEADPASSSGARPAVERLREEVERQTQGRVELIGADLRPALGREVASAGDSDFAAALAGEERARIVPDSVLGERGLRVTVPAMTEQGATVGAVRLTLPTAPVDEQLRGVWLFRLGAGAVVLLLSGLAGAVVATSLLRPLRLLDAMAGRMSRGDFQVRLDPAEVGPPETRRLAETLNDGAHRIDRLLSAQQAFAADASHQLRTPLTALRLSLDTLRDRLEDRADRVTVDRALGEAGRLSRLVSDLLVLAQSQASTRPRETVDATAVLEARWSFWQASAEEAGVRLELDPAPERPVLATPGHLEQAVDNLIDNALRASAGGGRVALRSRSEEHRVVLEIVDDGPGLSAEERERAFDRFWSTAPGGSGLGLAIARQLVEHDNGGIELVDTPGGGLTARLVLRRPPVADG
ncbi:sensor histidine kinase [Rathayibacter tanaceti]|uniref:histidine kinase n=2 Tax=Rathayibacter tanaceti TaxID=1671680 RepID=A0A162J0F2_9MICO|nr:HAMP domain-containing sensor histidine kinase [Rathayibacter tanaceti]KZX20397.1 Sensor protein CpxA [Rathayibacter tanaceti]QHC54414.1 HAMP domain-containing protein [Rathayibacter tanaceti]TCO35109.1 signal transduction histidine kinase [Rathayibacter tanaceti]